MPSTRGCPWRSTGRAPCRPQQLAQHLPPGARNHRARADVASGCRVARDCARPGDRVLVFGSFLTVGPALDFLEPNSLGYSSPMDSRAKQRLTGAVILVALFVLLVPELLTGPGATRRPAGTPTDEGMRRYTIDLNATASSAQPATRRQRSPLSRCRRYRHRTQAGDRRGAAR